MGEQQEQTTDAPVPQPTEAPVRGPTPSPIPGAPDPTPAPIRDSLFSPAPVSQAPVVPPTPSPVDPTAAPIPDAIVPTTNGGCSVCGDGKKVGNKDAIFEFPGQPAVECSILEMAGMAGAIPLDQCGFLPPVITNICDCQTMVVDDDSTRRYLQQGTLQIKETNRQYFERAKEPLKRYFVEVVDGEVTTSTGGNDNDNDPNNTIDDTNDAAVNNNKEETTTSTAATVLCSSTVVTVLVMIMSMMM